MKTRVFLILAAIACMGGCVSPGTNQKWWNPFTWGSGSEGRRLDRAAAKLEEQKTAALRKAQETAHETGIALDAAPESRSVEVARESNTATISLLDQVLGSLVSKQVAALRERVSKLLSENAAIRAAGERERAAARADLSEVAADLAEVQSELAKANSALRGAFDRENALANQLRNQRFILWGVVGLTVLLAGAWVYLRFAAGGVPGALGKVLAVLDREDPPRAKIVRESVDPFLNRIEQAKIMAASIKATARLKKAGA